MYAVIFQCGKKRTFLSSWLTSLNSGNVLVKLLQQLHASPHVKRPNCCSTFHLGWNIRRLDLLEHLVDHGLGSGFNTDQNISLFTSFTTLLMCVSDYSNVSFKVPFAGWFFFLVSISMVDTVWYVLTHPVFITVHMLGLTLMSHLSDHCCIKFRSLCVILDFLLLFTLLIFLASVATIFWYDMIYSDN